MTSPVGSEERGSLDMFLTPAERHAFAEWTIIEPKRVEVVDDKSIVNKILEPFFSWVSKFVPENIAPNSITLIGLLAVIQAWYFCWSYVQFAPTFCSMSTIVCIVIYWTCHGLDSKHAKRTMNDTPLGELFKYACDSIALVFLTSAVTLLFAPKDVEMQWLSVHTGQMVLLFKHFSAFSREAGMRYWFIGPGELVTFVIYGLLIRATVGLDWLFTWYLELLTKGQAIINDAVIDIGFQKYPITDDPLILLKDAVRTFWWISFISIFLAVYFRKGHKFTRGTITFVLLYRMVPTYMLRMSSSTLGSWFFSQDALRNWLSVTLQSLYFTAHSRMQTISMADSSMLSSMAGTAVGGMESARTYVQQQGLGGAATMMKNASEILPPKSLTAEDILLDGLFMTVLTTDLVLAKMTKREVHSWILLMAFTHALPHSQLVTAFLSVLYYMSIFVDLCWHMNLPLLSNVKNVYCDGVFDLCHIGHKNLFRKALRHGNRLFVGVCGDADCAKYKRPPIMTHEERCNEIMGCKAVTKVIPNAPTFGLKLEFLKKHRTLISSIIVSMYN